MLRPLELLADLAVPAALLAYGASLHGAPRPGSGNTAGQVWLAVVLKTVVQPTLAYTLGRWVVHLDDTALLAVTIASALPTAQNVFVYATSYDRGTELARDAVLLSTVLSVPVLTGSRPGTGLTVTGPTGSTGLAHTAWSAGRRAPTSIIARVTAYDDLDAFEHLDTSALPQRQQRILVVIRDWVVRYGYSPSTRQIGDAVGLRSSSSVSKHLASLEDKGFLRRGPSVSRPIDVRMFLQEPAAPGVGRRLGARARGR